MKRFPVVAVVFGLALLACRPLCGQGLQPVNLLTNGGFEDGTVGWQPEAQHERLVDPDAAHGGQACITGEVTKPNQALRLRRSIPVRAGNRYEFQVWARATNRTKLVLWGTQPGSGQRTMIANWPNLTRKWQRYRTPITVTKSGVLDLEIISPSSYGAPAGRIWLDDLALLETPMPPVTDVSRGIGFNDEPSIAAASDGSIYVAFNRFVDGADSLQVQRFRLRDDQWQTVDQWQVIGGEGTYLLGVQAVSAGAKVALVYAAERERDWNIYSVMCGPDGPDKPVAVSTATGVDTDPNAAWHDGQLWITWETNRNGFRQIYASSLQGNSARRPTPISQPGISSYDPSIAVLPGGEVCVAWHSFQGGNSDIFARHRSTDGQWHNTRQLTKAPTIDRHAHLLTREQELWILYENAQTERYHVSRTNRRRLVAAQITSEGLMAPAIAGPSPLEARCEAANALFDHRGRLWVAMLKPRLPRAGWDVFLTGLDADRWQGPFAISNRKGMDRKPGLALVDDRAVVCFQTDDMPQSWSDLEKMASSTSHIHMADVRLDRFARKRTSASRTVG